VAVVPALIDSPRASGAQPAGLYVALGDSIAVGNGASSPSKGYVQLYFGYLESNGSGVTQLANLAQVGATSTLLLSKELPGALDDINASSDTKAVTIDVGYADLLFDPNCPTANAPTCPFAENLRTLLTALNGALAADPGDETVQVMEHYNPDLGDPSEAATRQLLLGSDGKVDCSGSGAALGLNDLIYCISVAEGATPVDVLPVFDAGGPAFLAADHLFPSDAGHLAIAQAFGGAATPKPPPPPPACNVPRLVGKQLPAARRLISRAHCSLGLVGYRYSSTPKGTVLAQRPRPGSKLANLGTVNVTVSRGRRHRH
jgi:hypothetical protein